METSPTRQWKFLAPNPKSYLRQLFVNGTDFVAWDLYVLAKDEEQPMTPEQIAEGYGVPVEAVHEVIAYCESNPPEVRQDLAESDAWFEAHGYNTPATSISTEPNGNAELGRR